MKQGKALSLGGVLAGMLLISGCSGLKAYQPPRVQGTLIEPEKVQLLQKGLTKGQVRQLLGPDFGRDPFDPTVVDYVLQTNQPQMQARYVDHLRLYFDREGYLERWEVLRP